MDKETEKLLLISQQNELTEHHVYSKLARCTKDPNNSKVLQTIADEEFKHAEVWEKYTGKKVKPNRLKVFFYYWCARILGITFAVKLMEQGEELAQINYQNLVKTVPEAKKIIADEKKHEKQLIAMIDEERLQYMGSIVLGLNDALVELTGALAGFTFALQNSRLIAAVGLITGVAASFSMAASEYLSNKAEGNTATALKSAVYTGIAYIITVALLVAPYLLGLHYITSLAVSLFIAIVIIFSFNFYISVAKELNFFHRFAEMALLSLGVAALSFGFGVFVRNVWGVDI